MQPLISVIIPVFNTSISARRLLAILFAQTYENLEIICVDDGSTDDSLQQLKKLAKSDSRLKVFHQENAGASAARNLGLDHATGDLIAFLDSDDLITHDYFEMMSNALKNKGKIATLASSKTARAFSVCGFHYFRLKSHSQSDVFINEVPAQKPGEPARAYLLRFMREDGRLYSAVNKLFHAEIIKKYHLRFDVNKNFAEDTKFVFDYLDAWIRECESKRPKTKLANSASASSARSAKLTPGKLAHPTKIRLGVVPKPLYIYNFGTETSTVKKSSLIWQNWLDSLADFEKFAYAKTATSATKSVDSAVTRAVDSSSAGALPAPLAKKRLRSLKRRFEISHAFAVARAPISKSKKLKYLKPWQLALATFAIKFRP